MYKPHNFDKNLYQFGYSQYFMNEAEKLFGGVRYIWIDKDYNIKTQEEQPILCHTYLEIAPQLYLDAYGLFRDIKERERLFDYTEPYIVNSVVAPVDDALQRLKVSVTDDEHKRNVREYLRNNMLVVELSTDNMHYTIGLAGKTQDKNNATQLYYYKYSPDFGFSSYLQTISPRDLAGNYVGSVGFIPNIDWYYKLRYQLNKPTTKYKKLKKRKEPVQSIS